MCVRRNEYVCATSFGVICDVCVRHFMCNVGLIYKHMQIRTYEYGMSEFKVLLCDNFYIWHYVFVVQRWQLHMIVINTNS